MGRPREWALLGPSEPYPCHKNEAGLLYHTIPGRRGGQVQQCATPTRARPRQGQVWLGLGAGDHPMRKVVARGRLRGAKRGRLRSDPVDLVLGAVAEFQRTGIPGPTGVEFPHRKGTAKCAADHPVWRDFKRDLTKARKGAGDPWDAGYERRIGDALEAKYGALTRQCVKDALARERAREGKAVESRTRETARTRAAYVARGGDTGSAEYADDVLRRARRR